jgi:hypothetical protein|tara:strand:+ start:4238 stop:4651 length:414 start_codon:yes stop_codon:yes gene_type:complete
MKNVFDWLKEINYNKRPVSSFNEKDWDIWNSYMVHRFISMDPNYLEIVNEAQAILPQNKKEIYNIYKEYIPTNQKWNKYVKSKTKKANPELIVYLRNYWECSSKEAKEYIEVLDISEIIRILTSMGIEKKELKQLLK